MSTEFKKREKVFSFFVRSPFTFRSIRLGGEEVCKLILCQQNIITIEKKRQNVFANGRKRLFTFRTIRLAFTLVNLPLGIVVEILCHASCKDWNGKPDLKGNGKVLFFLFCFPFCFVKFSK